MIASTAYFEGLSDEQKRVSRDNWDRRFRAALTSQPGLVATFFLARPNGDGVAFSIWDDEQVMRQGMQNANAVPLLPGQRGEDIPGPTRMEVLEVIGMFVRSGT